MKEKDMSANCNECGRDTPKKVYLCDPCINYDPTDSDYGKDYDIAYEEQYWKDVEAMMEEDALEEFMRKEDEAQDKYWDMMFDREKEALHALTGN